MAKIALKECTVRDLVDLEIATRIICAKYENLNKMENFLSNELNEKFQHFKAKYDTIIDEIEKRVENV